MPNTKSAMKRMRTSVKGQERNRTKKGRVTTIRSRLYAAVASGDKAAGEKLFSEYCSALDSAVKSNSIAANAANRRKSRARARLAALA